MPHMRDKSMKQMAILRTAGGQRERVLTMKQSKYHSPYGKPVHTERKPPNRCWTQPPNAPHARARGGGRGGGIYIPGISIPRDDDIPYSPPYRPLGHFLALDAPQEGEKVPVGDVGRVRRVPSPFPAFLLQPLHHLPFPQ